MSMDISDLLTMATFGTGFTTDDIGNAVAEWGAAQILDGESVDAVMRTVNVVASVCRVADENGIPPLLALAIVTDGLKSGELDLSGGGEEE